MPRKRDGPAPRKRTPSQGQGDTSPASLPQRKFPRNTKGHIFPSSHRYTQRRQEQSWRGFDVRLYLRPGSEAHALYALLRLAAERYGLEIASVTKIRNDKSKVKKETDPLA